MHNGVLPKREPRHILSILEAKREIAQANRKRDWNEKEKLIGAIALECALMATDSWRGEHVLYIG